MPQTMTVTAPNGKQLTITGDRVPSEAELHDIFTAAGVDTHQPTVVDKLIDLLPTAGGMAGGIVGGVGGTVAGMGVGGVPGAVGGATLGGTAGEAAKELINRARGVSAPASAGDAALSMAKEGGIQGASELAGAGLARAATGVGRALMDNAVRPTMTLAREFPDVIDTIIKERLPVGRALPGMKTGTRQAKDLLSASAQNTRGLLTAAGQNGAQFSAQQVVQQPISRLASDVANQPLADADMSRLSKMVMQFLKEKGQGPISPDTLKDMKRAAQSIAKPVFKAEAAGNVVGPDLSLAARFNDAVAGGAKTALETIPGIAESEGRTQSLIGATRALRTAETRRAPLWAELAAQGVGAGAGAGVASVTGGDYAKGTGAGLATTMVARALLSPRSMSLGALVLTHRQVQQLIRQMPRGSLAALLSLAAAKEQSGPAGQGK